MNLYKDTSDMPISRFDKLYKTNNLMHLVVEYDGYTDVEVPKGANERWQEIKNEWVKLLDDNTITYYYQLILECVYLQSRYTIVKNLLHVIYSRLDMDNETLDNYIGALKEWRYLWNKKNSRLVEIERLLKQLKGSENKLNLKLDELETLKNDNGYDDAPASLEKQAVILEQVTGKNNIDLDLTSVRKWVEIGKLANEINEQRRKNRGK